MSLDFTAPKSIPATTSVKEREVLSLAKHIYNAHKNFMSNYLDGVDTDEVSASDYQRLNEMLKNEKIALTMFKKQGALILGIAIILYDQSYPDLLTLLLDKIPAEQLPFHRHIMKTSSRFVSKEEQMMRDIPTETPIALAMICARFLNKKDAIKYICSKVPFAFLRPNCIYEDNLHIHLMVASMSSESLCPTAISDLFNDRNFMNVLLTSIQKTSEGVGISLLTLAGGEAISGRTNLLDALINHVEFIRNCFLSTDLNEEILQELSITFLVVSVELAIKGMPELLAKSLENGLFDKFYQQAVPVILELNYPKEMSIAHLIALATASDSRKMTPEIKANLSQFLQRIHKDDLLKSITPLHLAIASNDRAKVEQILTSSRDKQKTLSECFDKISPLHYAVLRGELKLLLTLLDHGADVNQKCDGKTPLHVAVSNYKIDIARELLGRGADINAHDDICITPAEYSIHDYTHHWTGSAAQKAQMLKVVLSHRPTLSQEGRHVLHQIGPVISPVLHALNADYHRFSNGVKALTPTLPVELIGKVLSYVVDYKSEQRLVEDAKHITRAWKHFQLKGNLTTYPFKRTTPSVELLEVTKSQRKKGVKRKRK